MHCSGFTLLTGLTAFTILTTGHPQASRGINSLQKRHAQPDAWRPDVRKLGAKSRAGDTKRSAAEQPQNEGQRTEKSGQVNPDPIIDGSWNGGPITHIPDSPPNSYSNGAVPRRAMPVEVFKNFEDTPKAYQSRTIDIPFNRLHKGKLKFFGYTSNPAENTGASEESALPKYDSPKQSACGIPFNAFHISTVAIHPYFLKYAPLERYCMADVSISFWQDPKYGNQDMMLKVTDICCTDKNDPKCCHDPSEIKIDRSKAKIVNGVDYEPAGDEWPQPFHWFFMKSWGDSLAQPGYIGDWFNTPQPFNNVTVAQHWSMDQYRKNQDPNTGYPSKGWPTYENGAYFLPAEGRDAIVYPLSDWVPGLEPDFTPIGGGAQWNN